jgi:hypothetical protein
MSEETTIEPGAAGLLDNVSVEDPNKEVQSNPQATDIDHKAPDPEAPPTPTERPEYLPENFWKDGQPDYEGLAKSWRDLRAKISKGEHNAPADGTYKLDAFGEGYDGENPIAQTLTGWAKENGISQAAFDELAGKLITQSRELMAADAIDPAEEMKRLGPNANAMINGMVDWGRGMVSKGIWSKDDFEEFKIAGGTAAGLNMLMKWRSAYEGRVPIETAPVEGMPTKDELYAMVADPKYQTDAAYRQKVERLFNQVVT